MKDALDREIILGQAYGYSSSSGSWITVVVGKAIKETPKGKCTLEVISRKDFLHGDRHDRTWAGDAKVVHILPCHLFPVTL